jgi:hypothetical protein
MISLPSGLRYLPTAEFAMTPYGTEWTTDQNFVANGHLTRVTLRVGNAGATRPRERACFSRGSRLSVR